MSTKKLNALLATTSDDNKKMIEEILAARGGVEEATKAKRVRMSDEECHTLAEELKANINHRCQIVPFNSMEWTSGYIAGVIEEKRTNRVLYAIKLDDGRKAIKVSSSNLIRILDEMVEPKPRRKGALRKKREITDWSQETIAREIDLLVGNVGKIIEFEKFRSVYDDGSERAEKATGRIISIVPDKRSHYLLYRIEVPAPTEGNPGNVKIAYKTVTSDGIEVAAELDETGRRINERYLRLRRAAAARAALTPQDRVLICEADVRKAEERLLKFQQTLDAKRQELVRAREELDRYLASQTDTEGEPLA